MTTNVAEVNIRKVFGVKESDFMYEDSQCVAFEEVYNPQAPVHFLVVPRKVLPRVAQAKDEDEKLLGHLLIVARRIAKQKNLNRKGFRVVMNDGRDALQRHDQFCVQVMGGRQMMWPFS